MGKFRRDKKRYPKKYCPLELVTCLRLNEKGVGVVEWNGKTYNVEELMLGEIAHIMIYHEDAVSGEARAIKLIKESPDRVLPLGNPKSKIGSYQIAHFSDKAQDEFKQKRVEQIFGIKALPIKVGKRTFYRNKVVLHDGGFFPPGRGRRNIVIPEKGVFDLMEIDFKKYKDIKGDTIIRNLDNQIEGAPGEDKNVTHTMLGKKFTVNLNSFYQVNNEMAEKVYQEISSFIPQDSIVYDLFSGAGIIGIHLSDKAKKIYAVEINKDSHKDAVKNLLLNNIKNIELINSDANEWVKQNRHNADVVVVDPARSGLSEESTRAINDSGVKTIIYLSCNIETQKRDVDFLNNYEIAHIQPYDFFPQTYHIENLIVLNKK